MMLTKALQGPLVVLLGLVGNASAVKVASTYLAGYHTNQGYPVSSVQWSKYTDIKYAFAETTADGTLSLAGSEPDQLPVFVTAARKHGVKATVSVGGWTGSRFFSSSISAATKRTAFAKTCMSFIKKYNLNGLDFDWEYPNRQGVGCNTINSYDTTNFLSFLKELRQQPGGQSLFLTAAGSLYPWYNASGVSYSNGGLKGFADVLDYVMIMGYDVYGPWTASGGPNAPLARSCDGRNNQGGIKEGIAQWIGAGIPANKLVLGVPAYGHGFSVNKTAAFPNNTGVLNAYPPQNQSHRFRGSSWDSNGTIDVCGNAQPPGGTYELRSLISHGFLDNAANPAKGIFYGYDSCSQTPFVYNKNTQIWVSYDSAQSFAAKGKYILQAGLAGFAMWEAGGDYNNILVNAIRKATGLST